MNMNDENILWRDGAVGKKFVASFSGGQKNTLWLYKATADGTTINFLSSLPKS